MRPALLIPIAVFVALAGVFAFQLLSGHDPRAIPSPLIDQPVPEFALSPLPGRQPAAGLGSADLDGEGVQLVNFFASWCVPCIAEHPQITALAAQHGVAVHGVTYNDAPADTLAWLNRHGDPYDRVAIDEDRGAAIAWGVTGVPETYVVDGAGVIRYKHTGPILPETLERTILPLIRDLSP